LWHIFFGSYPGLELLNEVWKRDVVARCINAARKPIERLIS
jgi:hypothetical protein